MSTRQTNHIALVGFGTVGAGVASILQKNHAHIKRMTGQSLKLAHIVDKDLTRPRPVKTAPGVLHDDLDKALADPRVSTVVELVGGTTFARTLHKRALKAGKHVVTANKALLAEHGEELYRIAREQDRCLAFEASCCGGIPIISAIRSGLAANRITAIYGIVNGTCNYILTAMSQEAKDYATALAEAQAAGFAEADPTLDVNGGDSAHKLAIMARLAFGKDVRFKDISYQGIDKVHLLDIASGLSLGYAMKLLAIAEQHKKGVILKVTPAFVAMEEPLAKVSGSFNAVSVYGNAVGQTSYYGRGAGMLPTASAVVADIIETVRGNSQRLFDATPGLGTEALPCDLCPAGEVLSRYYLRLGAADKPGVFAQIAKILGEHHISISALEQYEDTLVTGTPRRRSSVPVIIMTHIVKQGDMNNALQAIRKLETIKRRPVCIPVVTPPLDE